jgi:integrase/recombinase XerD
MDATSNALPKPSDDMRFLPALSAQTDDDAVMAFLQVHAHKSPATWAAYEPHLHRWLLWMRARGKTLRSARVEDLVAFVSFLADPQPAKQWVAERAWPRQDPRWRPFLGPLSRRSQALAQGTVSRFMGWLYRCGYLQQDIASLVPKLKSPVPQVTRFLDDEAHQALWRYLEELAPKTKADAQFRWVVASLYFGGLRISELASLRTGDLKKHVFSGRVQWWVRVVGKGAKPRDVPFGDHWQAEFERYWGDSIPSEGWAAMPDMPWVMPLKGPARLLGRAALHAVLKTGFAKAQRALQAQGWAVSLEGLSAHYLRHTCATHLLDAGVDVRHVRDFLGHSNISTTNVYLNRSDTARHEAISEAYKKKTVGLGFGAPAKKRDLADSSRRPRLDRGLAAQRRCQHPTRSAGTGSEPRSARHRRTGSNVFRCSSQGPRARSVARCLAVP